MIPSRDVAQIDIPTLLDVRTYGDRLLIVYDKGEMRRVIVVICNASDLKVVSSILTRGTIFFSRVFLSDNFHAVCYFALQQFARTNKQL